MIQDTSFIIDLLHNDPDAVAYFELIEKSSRPEKIASATLLELYEAVPQLDIPTKRQQQILNVLDTR